MLAYFFVLVVALVAGCLSGVIGTGSSIMLLPVLVFAYGPKEAVPIMAVAAVMSNVSRVALWWRDMNWRAFLAYALPGAPAAALGARTLLALPAHVIEGALGVFFLAMVPARYQLARMDVRIRLWQLAVAGAFIGFLTGLVLSTGPLSVPAFTAYGLLKGPFLATEAASSLALYSSKVFAFRELGALPESVVLKGLIVGSSLMVGAIAGKAIVLRMSPSHFHLILDGVMIASGLSMLWGAFH
ncbi:sulfite exporter TauE/SafE family protein [Rhodanobacter sp. A1T4]|uniref:sulfite exporter TauE/SafE family protein n=1 Tax=Rhodanobacter sp. A1T4 TaxID=2723087 RepID=UPI0017C7163B|nr:sulfite exporter TauE/SafE family protein [Rhodanobacter sp. A1T4]MBB6245061.1 hypothetical protein [Rhodanobacter sp. A1T4]